MLAHDKLQLVCVVIESHRVQCRALCKVLLDLRGVSFRLVAFIYGSVCMTSCECAIYCAVSIDCSLDWSRRRLVCINFEISRLLFHQIS
jgi:hypothetical protein